MSSKSNTEVIIGGKVYTLSGYEGEEYLQRVAAYINNKINEFNEMEEIRRFPVDMKATLVELNIADDYFKAKDRVEKLEQDLEIKEKEIYELKHELISVQIQAETSEKSLKEAEAKNKELLLNKTKLEAALEDALLGTVSKEEEPAKSQTNQNQKNPDQHNSNQNNSNQSNSSQSNSNQNSSNQQTSSAAQSDTKKTGKK